MVVQTFRRPARDWPPGTDAAGPAQGGEHFAKIKSEIKLGDILFIHGEIGVGKTTFVKYLINNFQSEYNEKLSEVTSPTFNVMNEYKINNFTDDPLKLKSIIENNAFQHLSKYWVWAETGVAMRRASKNDAERNGQK